MKTTIDKINTSVQNIFNELSLLESLTVLLKNYCINTSYDYASMNEKQRRTLCLEKCNCINITDLALATIDKIKNTGENLEKNIFSLNQYTNNSRR